MAERQNTVIVRRECGRCGAEVRKDKRFHFCGEPYPLRKTDDIVERTYVAVDNPRRRSRDV